MTSALRTMLGTQKGFIVIIIYSGISEISQFQIFCHCSHISWKNPKMPANYTFGLPFSLSGRLLKQWGEENFLQSSLALNHVAPIVVIIKLPPALCIQLPRLLYHFFFFSFSGPFFSGIVICMLQLQFPPAACLPAYLSFSSRLFLPSFPIPFPSFSFLISFPPFLSLSSPYFQKSLGSLVSSRHYVIFFPTPQCYPIFRYYPDRC